jgi:hypothetical protein
MTCLISGRNNTTGAPAFSLELAERKAYTSVTSDGQVIAGVGVSAGNHRQVFSLPGPGGVAPT